MLALKKKKKKAEIPFLERNLQILKNDNNLVIL